jgi:ribosomal-protein-alanine N-acetyltransferase
MVARTKKGAQPRFRVYLRRAARRDAELFVDAVRASRRLHGNWVAAPATPSAFRDYLARFAKPLRGAQHVGYVAATVEDDALVGVLNLSEIVRGAFESAYLGYYALAPFAARGYMTEALVLLLDAAYRDVGLHRVEANVQPTNVRSLALVERVGFVREGYSRRYVKVGGRWRDHVRLAMLAEDWPRTRRALLARLQDRA